MKKILFTLCLAASLTGARGQIYIDSYRFGLPSDDLLLDSFPTAALAISFRLLDKDYSGNCITIQKDNGDTSNVAFLDNYLDTAAVKTFCGTGAGDSCRVRVWFDQSGNARNFRMDTAAQQPLIMINGALTYDNGEVAARFDGSNDYMVIPNSTSTFNFVHNGNTATIFMINRYGNAENPNVPYGSIGNCNGNSDQRGFVLAYDDRGSLSRNDAVLYLVPNGGGVDYAAFIVEQNKITPNQINISYTLIDANNATAANRMYVAINGDATFNTNTANLSPSASNATGNLMIGRPPGASYLLGAIQEIILYDADKSSDRTAIRDNINRFYSIY
jgi:hypothetical protein